MQNHSEIAEFLWKIADLIKDDYDAKDYEEVILPFTLLRRLDCVLQPTRRVVREDAEKYQTTPPDTRNLLPTKAARQDFFNTSEYYLDELIKRPNDLVQNFSAYCLQWGRAKPPPLGGSLSTPFCCGWLHE